MMKLKNISKVVVAASALLLGASTMNAQLDVTTGKKYVIKSVTQTLNGNPTGMLAKLDYTEALQLREIELWQANWSAPDQPILQARNKVKTDGAGRITQIDLYEVPGAVAEPTEPYPHMGRMTYDYDSNHRVSMRKVYDPATSLEEPESTAVMVYDDKGRMVRFNSSAGGYKSWDYNDKGQLVRTQLSAPGVKEGYETYDYNEAGQLIRKNFYSETYPDQPIAQYLEYTYEGDLLKQYLLHSWSKSKKAYVHRKPVEFIYDLNEKREDVYFPIFYHDREDPINGFLALMGEPFWPGLRLSAMTFGGEMQYVFGYKLSSEILPAQRIEMEAQGAKAYKSGNALAIEGLEMTAVEIYDMAGKQIYKLGVDADKLDLPLSGIASGLYLVKVTNKAGKTQTIKVSL